MRASCIIDNYNYAAFLPEAIESALAQTQPFEQIVIVDDGSTDASRQVIESYRSLGQVQIIYQENAGQLAALSAGVQAADGQLLCFLDADDRYLPHYLAEIQAFYQAHPGCDFLFCAENYFGQEKRLIRPFLGNRDFGNLQAISLLTTYPWIGAEPVAFSGRAAYFRRLLPYPHSADWPSRADDYFIYGLDVLGAQKYYLDQVLVEHRIHPHNALKQDDASRAYRAERRQKLYRMFRFLIEQYIDDHDLRQAAMYHLEDRFGDQQTANYPQKVGYTKQMLKLIWQQSKGRQPAQRIARIGVFLLAYLLNVQGSIKRLI